MNVAEKIGDFTLTEISYTKNRRGLPVYTFCHEDTDLQNEFHGIIPTEDELMEQHREWAPQHELRARLREYTELERIYAPSVSIFRKSVIIDIRNPLHLLRLTIGRAQTRRAWRLPFNESSACHG